jgi:A/G-specific adenine glycosylase
VPGIGPYTAGAIASIAFGEPVGLVDGNVARVLARWFVLEDDMRGPGMKRAQAIADHLVAREDPGAWNQALMELGATVCTPRSPSCASCPVAQRCEARAQGREATLPVLSAKAKPREARAEAVVARLGDTVLLGRRAGDRLFGGLWEPPLADGDTASAGHPLLGASAGLLLAEAPERVGSIVHVLSHRRLLVDVVRVSLAGPPTVSPEMIGYDAFRMVRIADLGSLGMSTLARKVLARAEPEPLFAAARKARKAGR